MKRNPDWVGERRWAAKGAAAALALVLSLWPLGATPLPRTAPPATKADAALLSRLVEAVARRPRIASADFGLSIVEAGSGRVLAARLADKEFAPASNFKLLVGAAALAYMGTHYRYRTSLYARGKVSGDELDGDLVVVGSGDPVLARSDLEQAAEAVVRAGLRRITGKVLADGSVFDDQRFGAGWAWDDLPYYYSAPIQGLAVDEGLATITATPGIAAGDPVDVSIQPNGDAMTVVSRAITSAPGDSNDADCFRSPGSTQIAIVGHLRAGAKPAMIKCAVDDANAYAAGVLTQLLHDDGLTLGTTARGEAPPTGFLDTADRSPLPAPFEVRFPDALLLWSHESPDIAHLLKLMMAPSDNFIADHLFKSLAVAALHERGSFDGGAEVERRFVASLGLRPESIDNGDGSGLSQGDRITPRDLTTLLRWETLSSTGSSFIYSLPRAGLEGTLRNRFRGSDAVGRVWAKTGYIWHVSTLSGYAFTKRHGLVVFSIMFNDVNGLLKPFREAQEEIVNAIVDLP